MDWKMKLQQMKILVKCSTQMYSFADMHKWNHDTEHIDIVTSFWLMQLIKAGIDSCSLDLVVCTKGLWDNIT